MCVCLINVMRKLRKIENNTHISLCQIYLPKLKENIFAYRLNYFREIVISFNNGLQTTSESLASLSVT